MNLDLSHTDTQSLLEGGSVTFQIMETFSGKIYPSKYIAKLRETKTDNNTQLLKCKMEAAGHGGMSGRDNAIKELAEEYSFILKSANMNKK